MNKLSAVVCAFALIGCVSDGISPDDDPGGGGGDGGGGGSGGGSGGAAPEGLIFGPYKDTSINMDWNTNIISTLVSGTRTPLVTDMKAHGAKTVTLSFATGECGNENLGGVPGPAMAAANKDMLVANGINYIIATGGAAGSFTCGTDAGMATFIDRWASPNLVGIDYDIEAGQSEAQIGELIERIKAAHTKYPTLRWQLTLATLANNDGSTTAKPLGASAPSSFNIKGDQTLMAVKSRLGFDGTPATWPSYVTVNLMTMDYGGPSKGVCVVANGTCDMGQSAIQAAYNLRDHWGVPLSNIELTPMIGGNDVQSNIFSLQDADEMTAFAITNKLAGVHYWSYDRDIDCPPGPASPTCNSLGGIGAHGFLARFIANGMN